MTTSKIDDQIDRAFAALDDDEALIDDALETSDEALEAELGPERLARARKVSLEQQKHYMAALAELEEAAPTAEAPTKKALEEKPPSANDASGPLPRAEGAGGDPRVARAVDATALEEPRGKVIRLRSVGAVWLIAAALAALGIGGGMALGLFDRKVPEPAPNAPTPTETAPTPPPTDLAVADPIRARAKEACGAGRWAECVRDLDQARAIDPAGDTAPDVKALREAATRAEAVPQAPPPGPEPKSPTLPGPQPQPRPRPAPPPSAGFGPGNDKGP